MSGAPSIGRPRRPLGLQDKNPQNPGVNFHPPGPGIGLQKDRSKAALGRASMIPQDHGSWKNKSSYARGSRGWKPDIMSIGDAHNCCPGTQNKGPQSPASPPNISGDPAGYNTKLFPNEKKVIEKLRALGYRYDSPTRSLIAFQRHWNIVSRTIARVDEDINTQLAAPVMGICKIDGEPGPQSLNAMEVALINKSSGLGWASIVECIANYSDPRARRKVYNAAQGS